MPKFKKTENELETHFDKWLSLLRNLEHFTDRPAKLQERLFEKLFKQAEIANYTEQEYSEYEHSLKIYRDLKNTMDTAFDDGVAQGFAKGIEKGIEKGLEQGKAEAILQTARKLKQAEVVVDVIAQTTGLTIEEIENLQD